MERVPNPSVHLTLSRAFVEHFVEPCGFWPFSTKWADKVQDKGPRTPFVGQALLIGDGQVRRAISVEIPHRDGNRLVPDNEGGLRATAIAAVVQVQQHR